MFEKSATNYFVLRYDISEEIAGEKNVSLYAEINDTPEIPKDGAYQLDIFIAIHPIGIREYVVGLIFGEKSWSRAEIESFVDSIIEGQVNNGFDELVKMLLHCSAVIEAHPYQPHEH